MNNVTLHGKVHSWAGVDGWRPLPVYSLLQIRNVSQNFKTTHGKLTTL